MAIKIKREKVDKCNICIQTKELSWDHVPPKSGIKLSSVEISNIYKILTGQPEPRKEIFQNGVQYRTICKDCNSKLGRNYDNTLNSLNLTVAQYLKSHLQLPPFTYVKTKPVKLIKALLGHLLSAKRTIDNSVFDKKVREYIFDDNAVLPDDIHIFYWIYPFDCTIIQRDFYMPAVRGDISGFISCHVLKYFPLAFLISDKEEYHGLPSITRYKDLSIDDEIELRINLLRVETLDWPEKIDGTNFIGATEETLNGILATPRKASR